jgi:hypothetical protein
LHYNNRENEQMSIFEIILSVLVVALIISNVLQFIINNNVNKTFNLNDKSLKVLSDHIKTLNERVDYLSTHRR